MKTAIEELIEWNNTKDRFWVISWAELDAKLKNALPKELEQIESAFYAGCQSERQFKPRVKCWEEYAETTFKK